MRKTLSLLLAGTLLVLTSAAAHADTSVGATINGDATGLAVTSPTAGSFSTQLDGTNQALYTTLGTFQVTDPRGTGAGWQVTFDASQFSTGTHTLPTSSLSMAGVGADCANTGCTGSATGFGSTTAIDSGTGVTVASAASGAGMGTYTLTPADFAGHTGNQLSLAVPSGAYAGSYSSTITITVADLP